MDEEKKQEAPTGAQAQIERLMKLKLEKDRKEKMRLEIHEPAEQAAHAAPVRVRAQAAPQQGQRRAKKPPNTVKIEKRLYDRIHKLVNALNTAGGVKITKAKFINMVLREFIELGIDYNAVKSREELKQLFERMKQGS